MYEVLIGIIIVLAILIAYAWYLPCARCLAGSWEISASNGMRVAPVKLTKKSWYELEAPGMTVHIKPFTHSVTLADASTGAFILDGVINDKKNMIMWTSAITGAKQHGGTETWTKISK